jgi:ribonuclease P protein component
LNRAFRLTRTTDFKRVRRQGKSYAHSLIVLIVLPNELNRARVGVAAGRSVGNAVMRNRVKRLMRSAVSSLLPNITPGHDIVLVARRAMLDIKSDQVREAIQILLNRSGLFVEENER